MQPQKADHTVQAKAGAQANAAVAPRRDYAYTAAFGDVKVHVSHLQGGRAYNEDRAFVAGNVPVRHPQQFLQDAYDDSQLRAIKVLNEKDAQGKFVRPDQGATLTAAFLTEDKKLHWLNVGDSPLVLMLEAPDAKTTFKQLTKDHVASDRAEQALVKQAGGEVVRDAGGVHRLKSGGLMLSRSVGDIRSTGVVRMADRGVVDLAPYLNAGYTARIVLASDGLGMKLDNPVHPRSVQKVAGVAARAERQQVPPPNIAQSMARYALDTKGGKGDNITAVFTRVTQNTKGNVLMVVADGHGGVDVANQAVRAFERAVQRTARDAAPALKSAPRHVRAVPASVPRAG